MLQCSVLGSTGSQNILSSLFDTYTWFLYRRGNICECFSVSQMPELSTQFAAPTQNGRLTVVFFTTYARTIGIREAHMFHKRAFFNTQNFAKAGDVYSYLGLCREKHQ